MERLRLALLSALSKLHIWFMVYPRNSVGTAMNEKPHCFYHHQFLPCRPPLPQRAGASSPGEAFCCGQGFGCSSTAPEQLSGSKYQPGDSAVPLPAPRAGSSHAGGCLPAHKVPGSCFWALNSPSSIFSWWRGGLSGGQTPCSTQLGLLGFAARADLPA